MGQCFRIHGQYKFLYPPHVRFIPVAQKKGMAFLKTFSCKTFFYASKKGNIYYRLYSNDRNNKKLFGNYSTPSISVGGKSAAWHLEVIISASPRLTSPSCNPLRLTKHAATTAPISIIVRFLFVSFDQWICYENRPYFPFVGVDVHRS